MAEVIGSARSLSDISAQYREYGALHGSAPLLSLAELVNHIAREYEASLFCWTSMWSLCVSQHRWTSPADWSPYLRIEPAPDGQIEFRYLDSSVTKLDWVRIVPPQGVVGRFDAFVEQLHWRYP